MLTLKVNIPLLFLAGLLAILASASAFAAPVEEVSVEVRNHQANYVGGNLVDGDVSTAWVGGGSGIGPGKWIEFFFPEPVRLQSLKVANGHQGKGQFSKFRRLTRGVILYPDGVRQKFTLKSQPGVQTIRLEPKTVKTFKVIITGVAPGAEDKAMGKTKVAVSEMTVHGEVAASPDGEEAGESDGKESAAKAEEKAPAPKPTPSNKSDSKPEVAKKDAPKPKVKKAEAKSVPKPVKPEAKKEAAVKAEPKKAKPVAASSKPEPKPKAKKPEPAKPAPKKAAPKKTPPKKVAKREQPKPKKAPGASGSQSVTHLRPAVKILEDKPLDIGNISPWLDLELVAQIKRYFALLTTLSDNYPNVLATSIRERERKAFIILQERMRAEKQFGRHHIAMLEPIGLSFDKPQEGKDTMSFRVHGPYRYYIENQAFELMVDTQFTLVRENGVWLISDVRDK